MTANPEDQSLAEEPAASSPPEAPAPAAASAKKKRGCFSRLLRAGLYLLLALAVLLAAAPSLIPTEKLAAELVRLVEEKTHRNCSLGRLAIAPYRGGVTLERFVIHGLERDDPPLLQAGRITLRLDWARIGMLLEKRIPVSSVTLEDVTLAVRRSAEGYLNLGDLTGARDTPIPGLPTETPAETPAPKDTAEAPAVFAPLVKQVALERVALRFISEEHDIDATLALPMLTLLSEDGRGPFALEGRLTLGATEQEAVAEATLGGELDVSELGALRNLETTLDLAPTDLPQALNAFGSATSPLAGGRLAGRLTIRLGEGDPRLEGKLDAEGLALRHGGQTVTLPPQTLTLALTTDPQSTVTTIETLALQSTLATVKSSGQVRAEAQAAAGFVGELTFDCAGSIDEAGSLLAALGRPELARHAAGALGLRGTIKAEPFRTVVAAAFRSRQLTAKHETLSEPPALILTGEAVYASDRKQLQIDNLQLNGTDLATTINGTVQDLPGEPRPEFALEIRLGLNTLARKLKALQEHEAELAGSVKATAAVSKNPQQGWQIRFDCRQEEPLRARLAANDGAALDYATQMLNISGVLGYAPDGTVTMHDATLAVDGIRLALDGSHAPDGAATGAYRLKLEPDRMRALCRALLPPPYGEALQAATLRGAGAYDPRTRRIDFAETLSYALLKVDDKLYAVTAKHDGTFGLGETFALKTEKATLQIKQGGRKEPVLLAAVRGSLNGTAETLAGKAGVSARGNPGELKALLRRLGIALVPPQAPRARSFLLTGVVDGEDGELKARANVTLNDLQAGSAATPTFTDTTTTAETAIRYRAPEKEIALETLTVKTGGRIATLQATTTVVLDGAEGWRLKDPARLVVKADLPRMKTLVPALGRGDTVLLGTNDSVLTVTGSARKIAWTLKMTFADFAVANVPRAGMRLPQDDPVFTLEGVYRPTNPDGQLALEIPVLTLESKLLRLTATARAGTVATGADGATVKALMANMHLLAAQPLLTTLMPGVFEPLPEGGNGTLRLDGQLRAATLALGDSAPPLSRQFELVGGAVALPHCIISGRAIRNFKAGVTLREGVLQVNGGEAECGGKLRLDGAIDFTGDEPAFRVDLATAGPRGLDLTETVRNLGDYMLFKKGNLHLPDPRVPQAAQAAIFTWTGLADEAIRKTMQCREVAFRAEDVIYLTHATSTDINRLLKFPELPQKIGIDIGEEIAKRVAPKVDADYDRMDKRLKKAVRYEEATGRVRITDGRVEIGDLFLAGNNDPEQAPLGADFEIKGWVDIDNGMLELRMMPVRNVERFLPVKMIYNLPAVRQAFDRVPENLEQRVVKAIPRWIEKLGNQRKLTINIFGAIKDPDYSVKVLHGTLVQEAAGLVRETVKDPGFLNELVDKVIEGKKERGAVKDLLERLQKNKEESDDPYEMPEF